MWLIRVRKENVRNMGFNESKNSYLHKNAKSRIAVLSRENGWVSSMVSLGRKKTSVTTNTIFKKKAELCLETQVISSNQACVLVSKIAFNNLDF